MEWWCPWLPYERIPSFVIKGHGVRSHTITTSDVSCHKWCHQEKVWALLDGGESVLSLNIYALAIHPQRAWNGFAPLLNLICMWSMRKLSLASEWRPRPISSVRSDTATMWCWNRQWSWRFHQASQILNALMWSWIFTFFLPCCFVKVSDDTNY